MNSLNPEPKIPMNVVRLQGLGSTKVLRGRAWTEEVTSSATAQQCMPCAKLPYTSSSVLHHRLSSLPSQVPRGAKTNYKFDNLPDESY